MKICAIVWSTGISGGTRAVFEIMKKLASKGHKVVLCCLGSKRHWWYSSYNEFDFLYIEPEIYIPFIGRTSLYGIIDLIRKMIKLPYKLDRCYYLAERIPSGCDVYISTYFPSAIALHLSVIEGGAMKIYFVQDFPELVIENEGFYGLKLFTLSLQLPFYAFLANSTFTKDLILSYNKSARVIVTGVGVDLNTFYPRNVRVVDSSGKPIVMAIIKGAKLKGSDIALKSLNIINRNYPIHAILVGEHNVIKRLFNEVRPEFTYTLFRNVNDETLAKLYSSSDIFVFTSFRESFGLPPLEAMACGAAVVTTDCGGNRDYAVDGYNSLVVPPGDPEAVAKATLRVLKDDKLRERLIEGGIKTAKRWTWDKVVNKIEEAIKE
jgi:glycosyltransferase involved in cell wall biosynthesis